VTRLCEALATHRGGLLSDCATDSNIGNENLWPEAFDRSCCEVPIENRLIVGSGGRLASYRNVVLCRSRPTHYTETSCVAISCRLHSGAPVVVTGEELLPDTAQSYVCTL
jgi:hypothetical protein